MVDKALMGEGLTPPKGQGLGWQPLQQEEGPGIHRECPGTGWRRPGIQWRRSAEWLEKAPGKGWVLRPHCCCHCPLGCCFAPPIQGEPALAGCGHAPPWPAPRHGSRCGQAPAPRNTAVPRATVLCPGTDGAALNLASLAGPGGP